MRCNLCKGVSYCVTQKSSDDTTKRVYRCKECGNVFNTIETKVQNEEYSCDSTRELVNKED